MNKFLKKLVLFFGFVSVALFFLSASCFFYFGNTLNDIPPPHISNNYSFNEKMEFLRKAKKKADIIAIGSSVSLNNLYSQTIINEFHSTSFLNTAAWGISMKNNFYLIKVLNEIYKPSTVIIASSIKDFSAIEQKVNYDRLSSFLYTNGISVIGYHLKNFSFRYYLTNYGYAKKVRTNSTDYEYLGFDKYGTVNYDSTGFNINTIRWNTDYLTTEIETSSYAYLDSLSQFCKSHQIKMLFFQSPYRVGLYSTFDSTKINTLKKHITRVETILKKNNQIFVNATEITWEDNLFIDGAHFNKYGAKCFTEYCFDKVHKTMREPTLPPQVIPDPSH
jgi:hypothetical protein